MIAAEAAVPLIEQFRGLMGFPMGNEAYSALVDALAGAAEDLEHAERIIEACHRTLEQRAPSSATIWRIAVETKVYRPPRDVRTIKCSKCGDSGWVESTTRIPNPLRGQDEPETRVFTGVRRCQCQSVTADVARDEDLLL